MTDVVFTAGTRIGVSLQCIDVAIIDSPTVEGDETFTVTLTSQSDSVVSGDNVTTITITDSDSKHYFKFSKCG